MQKQFIQLTSGWIPVSVLALFTAALVMGQAQANLPEEVKAAPVPAMTTSVSIILNTDVLQKLEALPVVVDTFLALPSELEVNVDASINFPSGGNERSSRSTLE